MRAYRPIRAYTCIYLHTHISTHTHIYTYTYTHTYTLYTYIHTIHIHTHTHTYTSFTLGEAYTWDYGSKTNPHLIRLIDQTTDPITDLCSGSLDSVRDSGTGVQCIYTEADGTDGTVRRPPGFTVPLYYDPVDKRFKIMSRPGVDYSELTNFAVFTTEGYTQLVSDDTAIRTFPNTPYSQTIYTSNASSVYEGYEGNVDCETNPSNTNGVLQCVRKDDVVFFLDPHINSHSIKSNPKYLNLYTVKKIYKEKRHHDISTATHHRIVLDMGLNSAWISSDDQARMYIFTPPPAPQHGYRIASECSNRGNCDKFTGK